MLKRLLIPAGAALIVAVILVAVYYQQRNAVGEGYDIKCVQPSEPSAAANSLTCAIRPSQNTDQSKPKPPWWEVLLAWPEGITAWLLMGTGIVIAWQSYETRRAAQAAMSAERAWMIPEITQPDDNDVMLLNFRDENWTLPIEIKLTNLGKSPAILLKAFMKVSSVKIKTRSTDTAPTLILKLPSLRKCKPDTYAPGNIYTPNKSSGIYGEISKTNILKWKEAWRAKQECLCVWGYVEYRDTFNQTHTTRFCYAYQETTEIHARAIQSRFTKQPERLREFRKAGPSVYNKIT